jgi:DNA-binding protein
MRLLKTFKPRVNLQIRVYMTDLNTVYIGSKPPMTYVMVVMSAFRDSGSDHVVLKARGRAISRAVDVAEILRNRYMPDVKATEIVCGTEQLPSHDGGLRGVSTLSITLEREKGGASELEQVVEEEVAEEDVTEEEPPKEEPKEAVAEKAETPSKPHEVSDLKGVGKATEEKLLQGGYKSVKVIARARADTMSKKTGLSENASTKIIASAKDLLS